MKVNILLMLKIETDYNEALQMRIWVTQSIVKFKNVILKIIKIK